MGSIARPNDHMPSHHIEGDMLLAYAAGTLGQAASIVVATHLSYCPHCRAGVLAAEVVGGAFLDDIAPEALSAEVAARALNSLQTVPAYTRAPSRGEKQTLAGAILPHPVCAALPQDLSKLKWSWVSPGIKYTEMLKNASGARVGLMFAQPGAPISAHGHSGDELTMVLSGGYHDGSLSFRPGDVQVVDRNTVHAPLTGNDGGCLSLVMISGPINPTGLIARIFRHLTPF
jgi:putative transcriptional regulator